MSLRDELTGRIVELPGVEIRRSRFGGGDAFFVGARELAHFHKGNVIDVRMTRKVIRSRRAELEAHLRVSLRGASDWVELRFPRRTDLAYVLELISLARNANDPLVG